MAVNCSVICEISLFSDWKNQSTKALSFSYANPDGKSGLFCMFCLKMHRISLKKSLLNLKTASIMRPVT